MHSLATTNLKRKRASTTGVAPDRSSRARTDTDRPCTDIAALTKENNVTGSTLDSTHSVSGIDTDLGLPELLDFASVSSPADISLRFQQIASALLHDFCIVLTSLDIQTEYEILEIEFYLQKSGCHEDPFTHGSEEQEQSGRWCAPTISS